MMTKARERLHNHCTIVTSLICPGLLEPQTAIILLLKQPWYEGASLDSGWLLV